MSRFGDLIRGKTAPAPSPTPTPTPEPVVETAPEPVVEEQSSKLSGFFSSRLKRGKKSEKTEK